MTSLLEMMQKDVDSVIGLKVSLDFGCSKPLIGEVYNAVGSTGFFKVDGEIQYVTKYTVSFNGWSYYTVDKFAKVLDI